MPRSDFLCIAHRGASSYAPENTLAAFDLALDLGCQHLELDVQSSRDGYLVVIHDATLDRTTNGHGNVEQSTLAELRSLDAGSWFGAAYTGERIPTLPEVLQRYRGRAHLHTEIKGRTPHLARRTIDLVRHFDMATQVTVTSFHIASLQEVRADAPDLPTGWLVPEITDAVLSQAPQMGLTQLCPAARIVTPTLVERLHAAGFVVRAWGVADEILMRQVVDAGADGMTVNFPDKLLAYLQQVQG